MRKNQFELEKVSIDGVDSKKNSSLPNSILHVAHNLIGQGRSGGTELYVDCLASWQKLTTPQRTVLALAPKEGNKLAVMSYENGHAEIKHQIHIGDINEFSSTHKECEKAFCELITKYHISVVQFHHLKGLPLSLPVFAKALGCRVVVTLHDFYMLCHRYTLLRPDDTFCEVHRYPDHQHLCEICLESSGLDGKSRNRRLETMTAVDCADVVLASTESSAVIASKVFPDQADRFQILEMVTPKLEELVKGVRDGFLNKLLMVHCVSQLSAMLCATKDFQL